MDPLFIAERLSLLLALVFFLGLAFEEVYKRDDRTTPGGIRTFPIVSFAGAALYLVEQTHALAFVAGLLAVGAWLFAYLQMRGTREQPSFIIPVCTLIAYSLGPVALTQPPWVAVALTVMTVILMSARQQMHRWVQIVPQDEILTAGQFLVLVGIILPLVPDEAVFSITPLTPYKVWLAVVAICATSYVSYLVQRYVPSRDGVLLPALMGGFYSSTATTVVLARRLKEAGTARADLVTGIVAATAVMYVRIDVIVGLFDRQAALTLAPWLGALALCSALLAYWQWNSGKPAPAGERLATRNPLQLTTASVFAVSFVVISIVSSWVKSNFGGIGIVAIALIVGFADVDPFVVSLAQGGVADLSNALVVSAVLTAASSNNLLKAGYALALGGRQAAAAPAAILAGLAVLGLVAAAILGFSVSA